MQAKILITGRPGAGKTTVVRKLLQAASPLAGGFLTEEIRTRGRRVGFRVKDVHSQAEGILSHVDYKHAARVGKYHVDVEALDRIGVEALAQALRRAGLIVIDEIGKMELCSKAFQQAVAKVMDSDHPVLATIPDYRHPLLERLRRREDVALVDVTAANRDELPARLLAMLGASGE